MSRSEASARPVPAGALSATRRRRGGAVLVAAVHTWAATDGEVEPAAPWFATASEAATESSAVIE
jgi:hypothetical protein